MKKILFLCAVYFGLCCIALPIFTSEVRANNNVLGTNDLDVKKENIVKQIKTYDGKGNKIFPYSIDELKSMLTLEEELMNEPRLSTLYKVYKTGAFSFSYNVWIGKGNIGQAFKNPRTLLITPQGVAKKMTISVALDKNGTVGSRVKKVTLPGGWSGEMHYNMTDLKRGKKYRFQLVNGKSDEKTIKMKNASIWYD